MSTARPWGETQGSSEQLAPATVGSGRRAASLPGPLTCLLLPGRCVGVPRDETSGWPQVAGRAPSESPASRRPPPAPDSCPPRPLGLQEETRSAFALFPRWRGGRGRGLGPRPEVLYLEKQILHDWTATLVLYRLCVCVFVCFFFFSSFSFLRKLCFSFHTRLSLLTPAFAFRAGAREREKYTSNSRMRPNKTEQQIPAHFVLDETKPSKSTWKKWHADDSAVTLRGRLSDAPLDLIIRIFFFFNSHSGIL